MMRRMVVACDYLRREMRGDIPAEDDESSEEDDDIEPNDKDESRSD